LFEGFSASSTGDVCRHPPPGSANLPDRSALGGFGWKRDDEKEQPWESWKPLVSPMAGKMSTANFTNPKLIGLLWSLHPRYRLEAQLQLTHGLN